MACEQGVRGLGPTVLLLPLWGEPRARPRTPAAGLCLVSLVLPSAGPHLPVVVVGLEQVALGPEVLVGVRLVRHANAVGVKSGTVSQQSVAMQDGVVRRGVVRQYPVWCGVVW